VLFYVAHRLFAAHDRAVGALVANSIAKETGPDAVFLPFCDTDEEDLVADVKGCRLYELDTERLAELSGMVAVLHGPSLDDGVCMEIGYAAACGVPIVALTTDFVTHGLSERGPQLMFPDPLIETVVTEIIRSPQLAPSTGTAYDCYEAYRRRNADQLTDVIDTAVARLLGHAAGPRSVPASRAAAKRVAFCEPSPYWNDPSWPHLVTHLERHAYRTLFATRFGATDPFAAARADWENLAGATLLIADVSGPETPPGAALMIGACAARGHRILARPGTPSWTFAAGREPNWRNLMIQYSVHDQHPDLQTWMSHEP
jgi:Nucleoside 2-deoxyribosyltransferase